MILHVSKYEKDGWIPVSKEKPNPGEKVRLVSVRFVDWNIEWLEWETTGWITKSGLWSLKKNTESVNFCSKPTHWKKF